MISKEETGKGQEFIDLILSLKYPRNAVECCRAYP